MFHATALEQRHRQLLLVAETRERQGILRLSLLLSNEASRLRRVCRGKGGWLVSGVGVRQTKM